MTVRVQPSRLTHLVVLAALGGVAAACAEAVPQPGQVDPRIRIAEYHPDQVYRLFGFVGFHIDLEFEADERFTAISGGDLEALTYSAHDNVLTLKPKVANTEMNLAVSTSKRRYYFDYTAVEHRAGRFAPDVMYAVRFAYPSVRSPDGLSETERVQRDLARAAQSRPRNVDYWYCGAPTLQPLAAADDGVHTRLTFAPRRELPALFVKNEDGSESLLNFSIEAGDVVIHRVAAAFIVRRGKLAGCIVNKGFVGGGERLESGTLAPSVVRERKELRP